MLFLFSIGVQAYSPTDFLKENRYLKYLFYDIYENISAGREDPMAIVWTKVLMGIFFFAVLFALTELFLSQLKREARIAFSAVIAILFSIFLPGKLLVQALITWTTLFIVVFMLAPVVLLGYLLFKIKGTSRGAYLSKAGISFLCTLLLFHISNVLGATAEKLNSTILAGVGFVISLTFWLVLVITIIFFAAALRGKGVFKPISHHPRVLGTIFRKLYPEEVLLLNEVKAVENHLKKAQDAIKANNIGGATSELRKAYSRLQMEHKVNATMVRLESFLEQRAKESPEAKILLEKIRALDISGLTTNINSALNAISNAIDDLQNNRKKKALEKIKTAISKQTAAMRIVKTLIAYETQASRLS